MGTMFHWWWFGICMWWWRLRNAAEDRAILIMRQGPYYEIILVTRRCITKDGEIYQYGRHILLVNKDHPFEVLEDERILGTANGELIATPFTGTGVLMEESLISSFMQGNATVQLSDSIESPGRRGGLDFKQLRWVLLAVGLIVAGVVVWKYVLHGHLPGSTPEVTPGPGPTPNLIPVGPTMGWLLQWAMYIRSVTGV